MNNFTFWYGGYNMQDLQWLSNALQSLRSGEWKASDPVYFDGAGWSSAFREEAAISLLRALRDNSTARTLVIRNAELDLKAQQALNDVFQKNHHLRSVSFKSVRCCNAPILCLLECKNVTELHLEQSTLSKEVCVKLGKMIQQTDNLKTLVLDNVTMQGGPSPVIASLLRCRSLRHLTLANMNASKDQIGYLLAAVRNNQSLSRLYLEQMGIEFDSASDIAKVLAGNRNLQELSLRRNNLCGDSIRIITQQGLALNDTLKTLFLSSNPIGDDGATHLVACLKSNSSLRKLCLTRCDIWNDGCVSFARGLSSFDGLTHLALDGNDFEECAPEILHSLQKNVYLYHILDTLPRVLREDDNNSTWRKVDLLLRMNKAKRRYLVRDNASPLFVAPHVLKAASRQPDVMYRFLRDYPIIFSDSSNDDAFLDCCRPMTEPVHILDSMETAGSCA